MTNLRSLNAVWLAGLLFACGGTEQGNGNQAGTRQIPEECKPLTNCWEQCVCVLGDTAGAECASQCSSVPMNPPGGGTGGSTNVPPAGAGGASTPPAGAGGATPPAGAGGNWTPPPGAGGSENPPPGAGGAPVEPPPPPPPPPEYETITVTSDFFDVPPGNDVYRCQNLENPFGGRDVDIVYAESFMQSGSHHMFVFKETNGGSGPVVECNGVEFKPYIHSAQTPQAVSAYPPGIGRYMPAGDDIRFAVHYLNTGDTTIRAQVVLNLHYVDSSKVTAHAAEIFLNDITIRVPPGTSTHTRSFNVPYDIKVLGGVSHMHKRGVGFSAKVDDGRVIYEGTDWDEPEPSAFPDGLDVRAGQKINWACTWNNGTGRTMTFGERAESDEMCIFSGVYYPAPGGWGLSQQF